MLWEYQVSFGKLNLIFKFVVKHQQIEPEINTHIYRFMYFSGMQTTRCG